MVTIVDYKTYQSENGKKFYSLEIQGGIEIMKSKETGRSYLSARKTTISCTFNEQTCKSLIGTQIEGVIKKVETEPYDYTIPQTGEEVTLNHRYQFMSEEDSLITENAVEKEFVI